MTFDADIAPTRVVRVLVVADDPLVRSGLALVLGRDGGVTVVGQSGSRDDVGSAVQNAHADVVLWDLGADVRAVSERVSEITPVAVPVLALLPDETYATDALGAGARGVLLRGGDESVIAAGVIAVARGLIVIDRGLGSLLPTRERGAGRLNEELTAREVEVLQLLAGGLPNKVIAQRLGISDHTVKFHVNAIMTKLGAESRTEAVVRAARLGLVIL
jgi:DNA-binding NarL/FixJ family response regulator